jgi:hypothetical protein
MNGWTVARGATQATAIHRWRPWERSTGPRTPDGKARSARNADRGGQWRRERVMMRSLRAGLGTQQDALGRFARTVNREDQ